MEALAHKQTAAASCSQPPDHGCRVHFWRPRTCLLSSGSCKRAFRSCPVSHLHACPGASTTNRIPLPPGVSGRPGACTINTFPRYFAGSGHQLHACPGACSDHAPAGVPCAAGLAWPVRISTACMSRCMQKPRPCWHVMRCGASLLQDTGVCHSHLSYLLLEQTALGWQNVCQTVSHEHFSWCRSVTCTGLTMMCIIGASVLTPRSSFWRSSAHTQPWQ